MVGNAGALLLAALWLRPGQRGGYLFAAAVLAVNLVLTFTDQFGLIDLLTLGLVVAILGILLSQRRLFFST